MSWEVRYKGQAKKALKQGSKVLSQDARDAMDALHLDLQEDGLIIQSLKGLEKMLINATVTY